MFELPQKTFDAPAPLPVVPVARPLDPALISSMPPLPAEERRGKPSTDKIAVASTVCGLTAFIPVISQLIGLTLGVWALFRIQRHRQAGRPVRGRGWATVGITGNGFILLGWIALFGAFAVLKTNLNETTSKLSPLFQNPALQPTRVRK